MTRRPPRPRPGEESEEELPYAGAIPVLNALEGLAHELLDLVGMARMLRVDPMRMVDAHDIPIFLRSIPGTDGWGSHDAIALALHLARMPKADRDRVIATEVSRWFLHSKGYGPPLQNAILQQFSLCWQAPYGSARRLRNVAKHFALAVRAFVHAYRGLDTPKQLLVRAAQACDLSMILCPADEPPFLVPSQITEDNIRLNDGQVRTLVNHARPTRELVHTRLGILAISYRDGAQRGVAIVRDQGYEIEETDPAFLAALKAGEEWDAEG